MKFYLKKTKASDVEWPFTIEQINQMVRERQLFYNSLVVVDRCESLQEVRQIPRKLWQKLADIPGFEPNPEDGKGCLLVMFAILILLVLIAVAGVFWLLNVLPRIQRHGNVAARRGHPYHGAFFLFK